MAKHKGKKPTQNETSAQWSTMMVAPEQANKKQNTHRDSHGKQPGGQA